jgi:tripartite-type tricarboxylate transporter receptor subunit TctC
MIKFITTLALSTLMTTALAQEIEISVPFSAGGHFSSLVPATAKALNDRGWQTNVKFVGKCGVSKETFLNSKKPVLAVWASNWSSLKDHTCYIDVNETNLVDVYMQAPNYLCGPKDNPTWQPVKGSTYTVAVTNSISKEELQAISKYGEKLGVTLKVITYTNSGDVRTAYHSKEIDMIFSTIGLEQHNTNQSRCLVTSGNQQVNSIMSIWNETGVDPSPMWVGFLIANLEGLTDEQNKKLKSDIRDIISNNEEIKSYMASKHLLGYPGSVTEQLSLINQ